MNKDPQTLTERIRQSTYLRVAGVFIALGAGGVAAGCSQEASATPISVSRTYKPIDCKNLLNNNLTITDEPQSEINQVEAIDTQINLGECKTANVIGKRAFNLYFDEGSAAEAPIGNSNTGYDMLFNDTDGDRMDVQVGSNSKGQADFSKIMSVTIGSGNGYISIDSSSSEGTDSNLSVGPGIKTEWDISYYGPYPNLYPKVKRSANNTWFIPYHNPDVPILEATKAEATKLSLDMIATSNSF